jgi:putative intracellular protease/amidase
MQVAIALYDRFTVLDAIGPYQVLSELPGVDVVLTAQWRGPVTDERGGAAVSAVATFDEVPRPDIVIVPGGPGQADHMTPGPLPDWLVAVDQSTRWTAGVCTGVLILAAAGLLDGREATTYWLALEAQERALRLRRQVRHLGGRVGRHRHGAGAGRPHRRGRRGDGRPARHRVRPAPALQRRLAGYRPGGTGGR